MPPLKATLALLLLCLSACVRPERATFCAVGDVLPDRGVRTVIEKRGFDYPFSGVADLFQKKDLVHFNLEGPIAESGGLLPKRYVFRGAPPFAAALARAGLNLATLANNHSLDCGRDALLETMERLERSGVRYCGAGGSQTEARTARIIELHGLRLAFLGYVLMPLDGLAYAADRPGPAQGDPEGILREIGRVRPTVDLVIVSYHWGVEFSPYPSIKQRDFARRTIEAGADLVLGHHPHVLQGVEKYKGKYIFYSLGNFVFDQRRADGRESLIFGCVFEKEGISSPYLIPVVIDRCRPAPASGKDFERIAQRMTELSNGFNTRFTILDDRVMLE